MKATASNIKTIVSEAMLKIHIKDKWDYKSQRVYKWSVGINAISIQFIPKALEDEKYSAYLFHSNHMGVWMGKYGLLNGKPRLFKPKMVMDHESVKKMAAAQNSINLDEKQKELLLNSENATQLETII